MDYSRQAICDLVFKYQELHDYHLSAGDDAAVYCNPTTTILSYSGLTGPRSLKIRPHHVRSPFESSAVMKVDLDKAIGALTWREKFILLATVYERDEEYFGDWCGMTPKQMRESKGEVLNKMMGLMNPGLERRGGSHGSGRPIKNQKPKSGF